MKYTDEFKDRVVKEYLEGATGPELAERYDISLTSVYRWLNERGITERHKDVKPYSEDFKDKVVQDYLAGKTVSDITEEYGIWPRSIYNWLEEKGIDDRRIPTTIKKYSEEFKDKVVQEYLDGSNGPELAKKYDLHAAQIYTWLDKKGITKRYKHSKMYTQEFVDQVTSDYVSGKSYEEIIQEYGITSKTLYDWLDNKGIPRHNVKMTNTYTEEERDEIVQEYLDGVSVLEIEERYGVSRGSVYRWLKKRGINKRQVKQRRKDVTDALKKKVAKEYRGGASGPALAKKYDISKHTVYSWAKLYDKKS